MKRIILQHKRLAIRLHSVAFSKAVYYPSWSHCHLFKTILYHLLVKSSQEGLTKTCILLLLMKCFACHTCAVYTTRCLMLCLYLLVDYMIYQCCLHLLVDYMIYQMRCCLKSDVSPVTLASADYALYSLLLPDRTKCAQCVLVIVLLYIYFCTYFIDISTSLTGTHWRTWHNSQ